MAKKITVEHTSVAGFDKTLVKVVTQSHRGTSFGNDPRDPRKFRASNGIVLASNARPSRDADDKNVLWLRGSDYSKDQACFAIPTSMLPKVVAAVREYNAYNIIDRTAAPAAPATRCTIIVG